ncbi:MAG: amphi-Trp domain-containing protein [Anaerolineae bacterium]|nr:amphi-Trp domain-containing protein [Anaerolineae bacterium]
MSEERKRDVEKVYSIKEFVSKLRRLADALESGKPFVIQVAGERIRVPGKASISIEHERSESLEELEFQLKWELQAGNDQDEGDEAKMQDEDVETED